jgi:hypothetical protein
VLSQLFTKRNALFATATSLHHFDLARPPGLGEERLERAVQAQDREETLFRIGLDPVAPFDIRSLRRAEVDRRRAVGARK